MARRSKRNLVETPEHPAPTPRPSRDLSNVITTLSYTELLTGRLTMDHEMIATIVDLARRGHPDAQRQLRHAVVAAMERDVFQDLPLAVRAYAITLLAV